MPTIQRSVNWSPIINRSIDQSVKRGLPSQGLIADG